VEEQRVDEDGDADHLADLLDDDHGDVDDVVLAVRRVPHALEHFQPQRGAHVDGAGDDEPPARSPRQVQEELQVAEPDHADEQDRGDHPPVQECAFELEYTLERPGRALVELDGLVGRKQQEDEPQDEPVPHEARAARRLDPADDPQQQAGQQQQDRAVPRGQGVLALKVELLDDVDRPVLDAEAEPADGGGDAEQPDDRGGDRQPPCGRSRGGAQQGRRAAVATIVSDLAVLGLSQLLNHQVPGRVPIPAQACVCARMLASDVLPAAFG